MRATLLITMTIVLIAGAAIASETGSAHPVRTARQAEEIAARNSLSHSPDADPKNWLASFDSKSRTWTACAARPITRPMSGFCITIDAKTGQIRGREIIN